MILLVKSGPESMVADWRAHFNAVDPRLDIRWWADPSVKPEDVQYVMVWDPEPGRLATFPNLKVTFSSAAGVDNVVRDPVWPRHLPLVRMGGDGTERRMAEFVLFSCLSMVRNAREMHLAQNAKKWIHIERRVAVAERRVGIMGMGNLGKKAAELLHTVGFEVAGWSSTRKAISGVESFAGPGEFDAFLARTDMLVCLLPSTPETNGLINAASLAKMPAGAQFINVGRGQHVVEADLIAALDSGHLAGALLDVFSEEPLPASSPFWDHPKVIVTPHVASLAPRSERARYVAEAILAHERGDPLPNVYDPLKGY